MYAIIEVKSKQYRVSPGTVIETDTFEQEPGAKVKLENVLLFVDGDRIEIGQPLVKNCSVEADVLGPTKGPKLVSFKYRRRKSSHWKKGHRQKLTRLRVSGIALRSS